MSREDWTLIALAAASGKPVTPVQLQKVLFLVGQEHADDIGDDFYEFRPYHYGPFSSTIYQDADWLALEGYVQVDLSEPGRSWRTYAATKEGRERAAELQGQLPPEVIDYVQRAMAWAQSLSFKQLVSTIYQAYPEQRANSVFVD